MSHQEPDSITKHHGEHGPTLPATNTRTSPNTPCFQSERFHRSNISLNDSGLGISPLTPRATVFTFDAIEIEQHIRESISSVSERDQDHDVDCEEPELARIVNSFASISSKPSESERIRPTAPLNCLKNSDKDKNLAGDDHHDDDDDDNDNDDENDENDNNHDNDDQDANYNNEEYENDDENDDVFLNDFESLNIVDEEQNRINNYLIARINRVEQHLSIQYHRRNVQASVVDRTGNGSNRSNILRTRFGGLQLRCQRFVKRILGMAMPNSSSAGSSLTPFGIEREFIERMTVNAANNEAEESLNGVIAQESSQSNTNAATNVNNALPDVVPDSAVMTREIMRNMARKERLQRHACHRSASFAAPSTSASVERQSIVDSRRTMSVSFPIEATSLTAVARQLREISIDFQAQNQMRPFSSFSSLYPVFDLLANTFIETTRRVSRVTRRRTFAAPSARNRTPQPNLDRNSFASGSGVNLNPKVQQPSTNTTVQSNRSVPQRSTSVRHEVVTPSRRPPTPQLQPSSIMTVSAIAATTRGRVVNNSRFYTALNVSDSANSSSQFVAKYQEENNNEY